jgi:hypothetical protein
LLTGYLIINNKYEMETIEETRRQVDREIKMMKQTPRISDKSKFLNRKIIPQGKHDSIHKYSSHQIFIFTKIANIFKFVLIHFVKYQKSHNPHQNK